MKLEVGKVYRDVRQRESHGSRDAVDARQIVLENPSVIAYGQWRPTAPSDPLLEDDFWDDQLGEPPNGHWDDDDVMYDADAFKPFDNFARPPYKKLQFG